MKQNMKRIYGLVVAIALLSGVTGAFAFSWMDKALSSNEYSSNKIHFSDGIFKESAVKGTPVQPVDLTGAAEKACPTVVYIKVTIGGKSQTIEYYDPFEDFFGDFFGRGHGNGGTQRRQIETPKQQGAGSGVIISEDGYIVTNNHVVNGAEDIKVTLNDNREFTAKIIGCDETTDLALIKIEASGLPAIVIGDSDELKVGEWVLAIGNPFNLTSTVTAGIVSAKARHVGGSQNGIESFIQTDAAINQGNSGGALVNARGELVGINSMLYSRTGSFSGYGFAIPTTIMKKVVGDLQKYGTVQRALIGVSGMDLRAYIDAQQQKDESYNKDFGTNEGVYVAEVIEDGAAAEAGLKEGDVIVGLGEKKITKMSELQEATTRYSPGDQTFIKFIRDKKEKTATIKFRNSKGNTNMVKAQNISALGAELKELTEEQKNELGVTSGVQVVKLTDGYLKKAGVPEGFIIQRCNFQNVRSVTELERIFREANDSEEQKLLISGKNKNGQKASFTVDLSGE